LDIPVETKLEKIDTDSEIESKDVKMQIMKKVIEDEQLALVALDGFLLVLNGEGEITYTSANISEYLGMSKVIYSHSSYEFSFH
jgi:hypothetical protein